MAQGDRTTAAVPLCPSTRATVCRRGAEPAPRTRISGLRQRERVTRERPSCPPRCHSPRAMRRGAARLCWLCWQRMPLGCDPRSPRGAQRMWAGGAAGGEPLGAAGTRCRRLCERRRVRPPRSRRGASPWHTTRQRRAIGSPEIQQGWRRALRTARAAKSPGRQLAPAPGGAAVPPASPGRGRGVTIRGQPEQDGAFPPAPMLTQAPAPSRSPQAPRLLQDQQRGCEDSVPPQGTSSGSRRPENGPPMSVRERAGALPGS